MSNTAFHKITLNFPHNLFSELAGSTTFEPVIKGRTGNHLVKPEDKGIPIVRTTTRYHIPANTFSATHQRIADRIYATIRNNNPANIPALHFNNALIEVYDAVYAKMNFHSDQNLDLANDSYIGLFSCYENPDTLTEQHIRKLKIKNKVTDEEHEHSLTQHSVILFSLATNTQFLHKIVLNVLPNAKPLATDNKWLGITFRTSKTYIQFKDNQPYFSTGQPLTIANEEQATEFFKLRGQENRNVDFEYPELTYTINPADTMMPKS
ncbi:hypothetical protein SAMN05421788_103319 [Filimonas lacunae]|uniref:2OG-Fe(II) oxygenase superfamily protein n=1 Tax=Filimonas lacunae TaxID=477680 RepID=A0A173MKH0_9BACT|nr:hypothetical protein [Filimonas lacunae]BAV07976.1 hypothetical protein FLA_4008 [Filimonas lacunae]SIT07348.1 hypothetical protein SAMN05421788_103319 [Filimonas lacunae]